jgi:hypothetical protein
MGVIVPTDNKRHGETMHQSVCIIFIDVYTGCNHRDDLSFFPLET